jgi:hypothetical protein
MVVAKTMFSSVNAAVYCTTLLPTCNHPNLLEAKHRGALVIADAACRPPLP